MDPDILYEVDMNGRVVWKLELPDALGNKQTEAELLPDDNILLVSQGVDLYKLDRDGNMLWEHKDPKNSHDADQLSNGNILFTTALRLIEVVPASKEIVWQLELTDSIGTGDTPSKGFYKAERIPTSTHLCVNQ